MKLTSGSMTVLVPNVLNQANEDGVLSCFILAD